VGRTQWIIRGSLDGNRNSYFCLFQSRKALLPVDRFQNNDAYQELNATVYAANINFSNEKCSFETKIVIL
jgi:hypothetical protein